MSNRIKVTTEAGYKLDISESLFAEKARITGHRDDHGKLWLNLSLNIEYAEVDTLDTVTTDGKIMILKGKTEWAP